MIRRPPRSTQGVSSAASDVYKRQGETEEDGTLPEASQQVYQNYPLTSACVPQHNDAPDNEVDWCTHCYAYLKHVGPDNQTCVCACARERARACMCAQAHACARARTRTLARARARARAQFTLAHAHAHKPAHACMRHARSHTRAHAAHGMAEESFPAR